MPDFSLLEFLGLGGTGLAVTLAVLRLFWNADGAFSDEFRVALSRWLQHLEIKSFPAWPNAFASMFDRLFGKRHVTLDCFMRSCIASFVSVLLLFMIIINFLYLTGDDLDDILVNLVLELKYIVIIFLSFNIFADYISLLQSRIIIRIMSNTNNWYYVFSLLVVDIVVTVLVYFVVAFVIIFSLLLFDRTFKFGTAVELFLFELQKRAVPEFDILINPSLSMSLPEEVKMLFYVFFLSTFFTSVWVWLCALSWSAVRLVGRITPVLDFLKWALPIKTHPMRAVGEVAAAITMVGFLAVNMAAVF